MLTVIGLGFTIVILVTYSILNALTQVGYFQPQTAITLIVGELFILLIGYFLGRHGNKREEKMIGELTRAIDELPKTLAVALATALKEDRRERERNND